MRGVGWAAAIVALGGAAWALVDLLAPTPRRTDLVGFSMLAISAWFAYLAALHLVPRGAWAWAFPSAWIGLAVATLVLAYKDSFREELAHFGPAPLLGHMTLHALVAPITVFFGFAVGFAEPEAWAYVLASLAFALLGGELLRRRLWPRERAAKTPTTDART